MSSNNSSPPPPPPSSSSTTSNTGLMGPSYPYYKQIKSPSELGMNDKGSTLTKNFTGLVDYVNLLVTGTSKASKTGKPLGNRFFLPTMGKCTAKDTGEVVPRFIYFDNIPQGRIPLISDVLGTNMKSFRGLIPGVISDVNNFNPAAVSDALTSGVSPECQNISLQVIDENNNISTESHYVATVDLAHLDPCSFPNKFNPVTKAKCKEGFTKEEEGKEEKIQDFEETTWMQTFRQSPVFSIVILAMVLFLFFHSFIDFIHLTQKIRKITRK